MPTDCNIPEPLEPAPNTPIDTSGPGPAPDHTNATAGASRSHEEAAIREWEGLPPDTLILAPAFDPPPMRCPDGVWAMLVAGVEIVRDADPDWAGEVALFAGCWVPDQPPAGGLFDGDLVASFEVGRAGLP